MAIRLQAIRARFASRCAACDQPIIRGTDAAWLDSLPPDAPPADRARRKSRGVIYHLKCAAAEPRFVIS